MCLRCLVKKLVYSYIVKKKKYKSFLKAYKFKIK